MPPRPGSCGEETPAGGTDDRLALAARTLRIDPARWARVLSGYEVLRPDPSAPPEARLRAFHAAYAAQVSDAAPIVGQEPVGSCPACLEGSVTPRYARSAAAGGPSLFRYGRCGTCGHGRLLSEPDPDSIYATPAYFERRSASGAGYDGYEAERDYRVAKGGRLLRRIAELSRRPLGALLEVGSGYGFTRAAAESLGSRTAGIDRNPSAAAAAARLYGMDTFVGTLADALESGAVEPGSWGTVLYDFVLEHVAEPEAELRLAARLLAPDGILALTVPSMAATEVELFGGSYRSFRSDHRHLFSLDSLGRLLDRAGLTLLAAHSGCTVHLLGGILTETELSALYDQCKGPDLTIVATLSRP